MTTTQSLLELSERRGHLNIPPLKDCEINSISFLLPSGRAAWAVEQVGLSVKDYRDRVSHEIGHCETGSFYTRLSPPTTRGKCEETARRWQYEKMLPCEELMAAIRRGIRSVWELAEEFDMPEETVIRAIEYYKSIDMWGKSYEH